MKTYVFNPGYVEDAWLVSLTMSREDVLPVEDVARQFVGALADYTLAKNRPDVCCKKMLDLDANASYCGFCGRPIKTVHLELRTSIEALWRSTYDDYASDFQKYFEARGFDFLTTEEATGSVIGLIRMVEDEIIEDLQSGNFEIPEWYLNEA